MSIPNIVHPWSLPAAIQAPSLTEVVLTPPSPLDDAAAVATALHAAGFVRSALALSEVSDDDGLSQQADGWRDVASLADAMSARITRGDGVLIPSVALKADGTPRFFIRPADGAAAADAIAREHGPNGVDAELRLFLDEALRHGDRFVDAAPGHGFAALSAASGAAETSVVVLCETGAEADAITASADASRIADRVIASGDATLGQLALAPAAPGASTILHLGSAAVVAPMLRTVRASLERGEIGAVAWRCGRSGEDGLDAEHMQVAAAVLGVFGYQHFALADGVHGTELVPAEAMASNELIFSLTPGFMARFAA
jgi:hypothetical protein